MSLRAQQLEVENLKKEYFLLTGLLKNHQQAEKVRQQKHLYDVKYNHPNPHLYAKFSKTTKLDNRGVYKLNHHSSASSSQVQSSLGTDSNFAGRRVLYKTVPSSLLLKQNANAPVKQSVSNLVPKLPTPSYRIVETSNSEENNKLVNSKNSLNVSYLSKNGFPKTINDIKNKFVSSKNSLTVPKPYSKAVNNAGNKFVSSKNSLTVPKPYSKAVNNAGNKSVSSKNSITVPSLSKTDDPKSLTGNGSVGKKTSKSVKVSRVSCSDCVIEILEYENGEMQINQKKLTPQHESSIKQNPLKSPGNAVSRSAECEDLSLSAINESKLVPSASAHRSKGAESTAIPSECTTKTVGCSFFKEHDKKLVSPLQGSSCGTQLLTASFTPPLTASFTSPTICNTTVSKSHGNQRVVVSSASAILPSTKSVTLGTSCMLNAKYSKINVSRAKTVQNSNAVQLLKHKHTVKRQSKSIHTKTKSQRSTSVGNCVARSPLSSFRSSVVGLHKVYRAQSNVTPKIPKLYLKNAYKFVNKPNPFASSRSIKSISLNRSVIHNKTQSSHLIKHRLLNIGKNLIKSDTSSKTSVEQSPKFAQSVVPSGSQVSKCKSEMCISKAAPQVTQAYKLNNVLNTSKIITHHSLRRVQHRRAFSKKMNSSPFLKSTSDKTTIKSPRSVRLQKTAYKVVNRHANHVSQVVRMIKTKYKTVNARSTSNSHLTWLREQQALYVQRKFQKSLHGARKRGYRHDSVQPVRKRIQMHSKPSRKLPADRNKVLKKIHGVNYKVSKTRINKSVASKTLRRSGITPKSAMNMRGSRFKVATSGRSLIRQSGNMYVNYKISGRPSSQAQSIASRMINRSIHMARTAAAKKSLKKDSRLCMFFNRFGRCNKGTECPYVHDSSKIAVCTRFLRGTCKNNGCPFSHEISHGKMALCSYYLQDKCTNENCPYQHKKIESSTKLCKAFTKGFCSKGSKCQDAHILVCPQLICEGFCDKGPSCIWPHPPGKKYPKENQDVHEENQETKNSADTNVNDDAHDTRYFVCENTELNQSAKNVKISGDINEFEESSLKIHKGKNSKLGKQPEYIHL